MGTIYSEIELSRLIEKLNLLMPDESKWRATKAKVSHIDLFGDKIGARDIYYQRSGAAPYSETEKLSIKSMAKVIYCLESDNPVFHAVASRLLEIKKQHTCDKINELAARL